MTKIIKETQDYVLFVSNGEEPSYQVQNKGYGVIEVDTQILPQALKFLVDLQAALDAMRDMKEDGKIPKSVPNLIELPTRKG